MNTNCLHCKFELKTHKQAGRPKEFCNGRCRYRYRMSNGLCDKCPNTVVKGKTLCVEHIEQRRLNQRQRREDDPTGDKARSKAFRDSRRAFMNKLKSKPCHDCRKSFPPYCMDFDHRDINTKKFDPSQLFKRSMKTLLEEVAKCDLVCANCHRIRSHNQGF